MIRTTLILGLLLLAACAQQSAEPTPEEMMAAMPCHQMPDGSWMGDCSEEDMEGHGKMEMHGTMQQEDHYLPRESKEERTTTALIRLEDGDSYTIRAAPVEVTLAGKSMTMLAYNGMIPGPIIAAEQGASVTVNFENELDQETTVHWHGLRHDNKDDGVPGVTQPAVQSGESFAYTVQFPDGGIYWYHPHVREDLQQDLGLYGNMLVTPENAEYNPVNREEIIVLDDLLLDEEGIVPYGKEHATHALMGRFGNLLLVNGQETYDLDVQENSVVRFYVTNVANARPFKLSFGGAKMKLVGSDLSLYEQEEFVHSITIAPAERYIVEVLFEEGEYRLTHTTPSKTYDLGTILAAGSAEEDHTESFSIVKKNHLVVEDIASFSHYFDKEPEYTLELDVEMMMQHQMPMEEEHHIEWEDSMPMMNAMMDASTVHWIIRDAATGEENMDLSLKSTVGDALKIRLVNLEEGNHPMQHPIHLHGQRFLITHIDGEPVDNKAWKDTVLVPIGSTIDILVDVTNPGEWMLHCHIAEHLEAGMMAGFSVEA